MLKPGATIGILGGGQLGRMLAVAAAQLGYRTHVLAPDEESVAAQTASSLTRADYHNKVVLADFVAACDVVTYEFENVDVTPVEWLAERLPVHPRSPRCASRKIGSQRRASSKRSAAARPLGRGELRRRPDRRAGADRLPRHPEDHALRL